MKNSRIKPFCSDPQADELFGTMGSPKGEKHYRCSNQFPGYGGEAIAVMELIHCTIIEAKAVQ